MIQSHQTGLSDVTGDEFKLVMRKFAANVITSADSSKKSGMTVTAVL
jgi:hypothetical protein